MKVPARTCGRKDDTCESSNAPITCDRGITRGWFTGHVDSAWVGVVGAMVGAAATYPLQILQAKRSDAYSRSQHLRAERVAAYSRFAEKIMDWRRSQNLRKKHTFDPNARAEDDLVIRDENQRVRAAAWSAFYQVKLLCGDAELERLATATVDSVDGMKDQSTLEAVQVAGEEVRAKLDLFLDAASRQTTAMI